MRDVASFEQDRWIGRSEAQRLVDRRLRRGPVAFADRQRRGKIPEERVSRRSSGAASVTLAAPSSGRSELRPHGPGRARPRRAVRPGVRFPTAPGRARRRPFRLPRGDPHIAGGGQKTRLRRLDHRSARWRPARTPPRRLAGLPALLASTARQMNACGVTTSGHGAAGAGAAAIAAAMARIIDWAPQGMKRCAGSSRSRAVPTDGDRRP